MDTIIDYLARGLVIQLSEVVNQIIYDHQGVCIHTQRQIYQADAVIVTVSIGVLHSGQPLQGSQKSKVKHFEPHTSAPFDLLRLRSVQVAQ